MKLAEASSQLKIARLHDVDSNELFSINAKEEHQVRHQPSHKNYDENINAHIPLSPDWERQAQWHYICHSVRRPCRELRSQR
jgi:hypothetical protein